MLMPHIPHGNLALPTGLRPSDSALLGPRFVGVNHVADQYQRAAHCCTAP